MRALIVTRLPEGHAVMGDVIETQANKIRLTWAYDDTDSGDSSPTLRLFSRR